MLTQAEAEQEVIRRFNLLAEHDRETFEQADAYAVRLAEEIHFESLMDRQRIIAAWLIRDISRNRGKWEAYAA
jgi:hypothetical protein